MDTPVTHAGVVIPQTENKGTVEFKGVDFSYPKHDNIKVLRNVKIEVNE